MSALRHSWQNAGRGWAHGQAVGRLMCRQKEDGLMGRQWVGSWAGRKRKAEGGLIGRQREGSWAESIWDRLQRAGDC
eukprot:366229-Chlamydomonas_euryale.AAC.66